MLRPRQAESKPGTPALHQLRILKACAIQPRLRRRDREHNLARVLELTERALREFRPHLVVLPNYIFQTGRDTVPGPALNPLARLAVAHDCHMVGGVARITSPERGENSAFFITPQGEVSSWQSKLHLLSSEQRRLDPGLPGELRPILFAQTGCVLCNDIFYPEVARGLALEGAEVILVPSAVAGLGVKALEIICPARALENQVFIINANMIPEEASREHPALPFGASGIYSPFSDEMILARAGGEETVITALLDLESRDEMMATSESMAAEHGDRAQIRGFNMLSGRRPQLYGTITREVCPRQQCVNDPTSTELIE